MTTIHTARRTRLGAAVAGTILMTAHTFALAEPVSLELELLCPFPLIGEQPILARISADYPKEVTVGESFGPFNIDTVTVVNEASRQGLALLGAATVTGTAQSATTIVTPARTIENAVELTVALSPVPATEGEFEVAASGMTGVEEFVEGDVGAGQVTVEDLTLNLRNLREDGTLAGMPVGEFTTDCAVVEGQDTVLANFNIVEGDGTGEPTPPSLAVDVEAVDFGNVQMGTSDKRSVTITNNGGGILAINSVTVSGTDAAAFIQTNDCTTLASGESCTVEVTFTSASDGAQSAVLSIASDDKDEAVVTVDLAGQVGDDTDGGGSTSDIRLNVAGSTTLAATRKALPLTGLIESNFDESTGMLTADVQLDPTSGTFRLTKLLRKLTATVNIEFESVGEATGTLIDGKLTTTTQAYVKVPEVTVNLFGLKLPIGGGEACRTAEPTTITVESQDGETFVPTAGGIVDGSYDMTALENCGALTTVLSDFLEGQDNSINLVLTPAQP